MPKSRTPVKTSKAKSVAKRIKFKIGGRKNGKSALQMSTEALKKVVESDARPRDRRKAEFELNRRNS